MAHIACKFAKQWKKINSCPGKKMEVGPNSWNLGVLLSLKWFLTKFCVLKMSIILWVILLSWYDADSCYRCHHGSGHHMLLGLEKSPALLRKPRLAKWVLSRTLHSALIVCGRTSQSCLSHLPFKFHSEILMT